MDEEIYDDYSLNGFETTILVVFLAIIGFPLLIMFYFATEVIWSMIPGLAGISCSFLAGVFGILRFPHLRWVNLITTVVVHGIGFTATISIFMFLL